MTDKIIIDGVVVSGCEYFCRNEGGHSRYEKEKVCELEQDLCEDSPNCLYKQLQRKTQECEEQKKQI